MISKRRIEEVKNAELILLLKKVRQIKVRGLSRFVREHFDNLPTWKKQYESVSNQHIGMAVGMRLRSLSDHGAIKALRKPETEHFPTPYAYESY